MMTGSEICAAPSRMLTVSGLPSARLRWMFSTVIVATSTSRPIERLRPPSVMMLKEFPVILSPTIAQAIESGIEAQATSTLRQLPRKIRIMSETRSAAVRPSVTTLLTAARTNTDWSKSTLRSRPCGAVARMSGKQRARRFHDGDGGRVGLFQDRHVRGAATIHAHDVGLVGKAVGDVGDVANSDGRAVDDLDWNRGELGDCRRTRVQSDVVLARAEPRGAGGNEDVRREHGADDVFGGEPLGGEERGVDVDGDLARLAAVGRRRGEAGDREEP